jgi:hypothetical protein
VGSRASVAGGETAIRRQRADGNNKDGNKQ